MLPAFDDEEQQEEPKKKSGWKGPVGSINKGGRPKRDPTETIENTFTNKDLKNRELLMLLRKLKPHVAEAVMASVQVMQKSESDQNKLRAADMILKNFHRLVLDMYAGPDEEPDEKAEEIQKKSAPVFSLRMIETPEDAPEGETGE